MSRRITRKASSVENEQHKLSRKCEQHNSKFFLTTQFICAVQILKIKQNGVNEIGIAAPHIFHLLLFSLQYYFLEYDKYRFTENVRIKNNI